MLRNLCSDRSWFDCSVSPCDKTPDASENPTRLIHVERELALNMFVGESADKLVIVQFPCAKRVSFRSAREAIVQRFSASCMTCHLVLPTVFPRYDHHVCFDSDG